MKYKVKDYAEVLYDISQIKGDREKKNAVADFLNVVKEHYVESWMPNIFQNFENIYNKNIKHSKVEIISAYRLENNQLQEIKKLIVKHSNNDNIEIHEKIDKDVIGGFKAEADYLRIKASLKDKIEELKI